MQPQKGCELVCVTKLPSPVKTAYPLQIIVLSVSPCPFRAFVRSQEHQELSGVHSIYYPLTKLFHQ